MLRRIAVALGLLVLLLWFIALAVLGIVRGTIDLLRLWGIVP